MTEGCLGRPVWLWQVVGGNQRRAAVGTLISSGTSWFQHMRVQWRTRFEKLRGWVSKLEAFD